MQDQLYIQSLFIYMDQLRKACEQSSFIVPWQARKQAHYKCCEVKTWRLNANFNSKLAKIWIISYAFFDQTVHINYKSYKINSSHSL